MLEHWLCLELQKRGLIEQVFPVMIGDIDAADGKYSHYFGSGCQPKFSGQGEVVESIKKKLCEHLERVGLGSPLQENMTAKDIFAAITINQRNERSKERIEIRIGWDVI